MQMNGHEVTMAHTVADALSALRGGEVFDVLVSDMACPMAPGST